MVDIIKEVASFRTEMEQSPLMKQCSYCIADKKYENFFTNPVLNNRWPNIMEEIGAKSDYSPPNFYNAVRFCSNLVDKHEMPK